MQVARVIPCLDVTAGRVVKGTNFVDLRDAGDPVELAARYDAEGADELVFLDITASAEERARRRTRDRSDQGHTASYDAILADVQRRDQIDSNRQHSPLRPATDAILIDSTDQPPAAIVNAILQMIQEPVNGER